VKLYMKLGCGMTCAMRTKTSSESFVSLNMIVPSRIRRSDALTGRPLQQINVSADSYNSADTTASSACSHVYIVKFCVNEILRV